MKNVIRNYQQNAINMMSESFRSGYKHIMLMLATGAGKTTVASYIIQTNLERNSNFKCMFICDRIELINQTSVRFTNDGIDHGVIQADHIKTDESKNVQICSIQTLAARYKKTFIYDQATQSRKEIVSFKKPDLIFIDEAHTLHNEHKEIMRLLPNTPIVGLSATPFPVGLGKYFKKLVVGATTKQLQELGYLVKAKVFAPSKPDLEKIKIVDGDYKQDELEKEVIKPKLIGDIVEHYIKLAHNKPAICFAVNIAHSKAIREAFWKANIHCEHLDAYTDETERKNIIERFRKGEIKVLTSVEILTKGFDCPAAEVAILARPTKSLSVYIQQIGRVLRISPETGKKGAIILDHSGNTEEHGFCDDDREYFLDDGEKKKGGIKLKKCKEEKVNICPSCFFAKTKFVCENCNFEFLPKNKIVTEDGSLVEIEKDEIFDVIPRKTTKAKLAMHPIKLYSELLQMCKDKEWKTGRAYYLFNDIVGSFPDETVKNEAEATTVSEQVYNMVTHLNIKNARRKFKKTA